MAQWDTRDWLAHWMVSTDIKCRGKNRFILLSAWDWKLCSFPCESICMCVYSNGVTNLSHPVPPLPSFLLWYVLLFTLNAELTVFCINLQKYEPHKWAACCLQCSGWNIRFFFLFMTQAYIQFEEKKNKEKQKKRPKKTIKLKAAIKKKHCSIMVCIQICPGYIVCHSGGYFCIHCLVCLRVTGLHQLHMNILQTVWCSYHSEAKTVQFTVQYITILLCFIVKWLKLPKLKAAYIISFFFFATVIGYYFSKLLKSWIVHYFPLPFLGSFWLRSLVTDMNSAPLGRPLKPAEPWYLKASTPG